MLKGCCHIALYLAMLSPAFAKTNQELIDQYHKNITLLEQQINGWVQERTKRCRNENVSACEAAFNIIIARHRAEQEMNYLRIHAMNFNEDRKNVVFHELNDAGMD